MAHLRSNSSNCSNSFDCSVTNRFKTPLDPRFRGALATAVRAVSLDQGQRMLRIAIPAAMILAASVMAAQLIEQATNRRAAMPAARAAPAASPVAAVAAAPAPTGSLRLVIRSLAHSAARERCRAARISCLAARLFNQDRDRQWGGARRSRSARHGRDRKHRGARSSGSRLSGRGARGQPAWDVIPLAGTLVARPRQPDHRAVALLSRVPLRYVIGAGQSSRTWHVPETQIRAQAEYLRL